MVRGQWDQICSFLERTVAPIEWLHEPWTVDRFQQAVRAKKVKVATGPDDVSRADLLALPPSAFLRPGFRPVVVYSLH